MKTTALIFGFTFLMGFSGTEAQTLQRDGDHFELVFTSKDAGKAHASANVFARDIGDILKVSYPSKVLDPSIRLTVFTRNNQKLFRLVWSCRVVRTSANDADYYFDRRGTLLWGVTPAEAKRKVGTEIETSRKVWAMHQNFRGAKIPKSFIQDSISGSRSEGYWYLKEFFMVAPR